MKEQVNNHFDIHREAINAAINIVRKRPKPAIVKILSDIVDIPVAELTNKVSPGEEHKE